MEQRATVKRYMLFAHIFTAVGVALGVFLLVSGNAGGWALLGLLIPLWLAAVLFIGSVRRDQP
jgi:hypothetical protein